MLKWRRCSEFTADRASALALEGQTPWSMSLFCLKILNAGESINDALNEKVPEFMLPVIQDLEWHPLIDAKPPDPTVRQRTEEMAVLTIKDFQRANIQRETTIRLAYSDKTFNPSLNASPIIPP